MLDPIVQFIARLFERIGRGIGWLVALACWPFTAFWRWLKGRGWFIKIPVFAILLALIIGYGHFFYITQFWHSGDPDYVARYHFQNRSAAVGERLADSSCQPSAMVVVTADLIDGNVNTDTWVSSNPLSKAGFFGIEWKETPFFDNKAAFQLGINQVLRRTVIELVDRLGRVRGTSSINQNLQEAREAINYREDAWFITFSPPFLQPTTQARMRDARRKLLAFNEELGRCSADFDARADNLLQFFDRVTGDIGSTSEILQRRVEVANFFGFDRRADDRFWFTYGQLFAYYGILAAARSDFRDVAAQRNLDAVWNRVDGQLREALRLRPPVVMNGSASSLIKSHLESIGFALLRVRSNLVELRDVLDR
ncbi:MAG: membrane protein [Alphaproteobacteria bacterium]|nr:MAG: membrane protein [Alphaproteobacteria bacterium]